MNVKFTMMIALLFVVLSEAPQAHAGKHDLALERLRTAVTYEVSQKSLPALSIAVVDGEDVIWTDGFGFRTKVRRFPPLPKRFTESVPYRKLFTDLAVLQLVEHGQLDLDQPVQEYLPEFAPKNPFGSNITLRQLMSHRSGLVRETPVGNYFDPDEPTLAATVRSLNQTTLVYPPDAKTKYSNAAVAVVGAALESQLNESHPEYVRKQILQPLEMNSSDFSVTPAVSSNLAEGWMRTYDGRRFPAPTFLLGTGPAGNLYSSVQDLAKFVSCLFRSGATKNGKLVKPETFAEMTTPGARCQWRAVSVRSRLSRSKNRWSYSNWTWRSRLWFSTQLEALPERKLGVVVAASLDGTNGVLRRISDYALRLMLAVQDEKPLPEYRTTVALPADRAKALVGRYRQVDGQRHARIEELDGQVYLWRGSYRYNAAGRSGRWLDHDRR